MKLVAELPPNAVYTIKDGPLQLTVGHENGTLKVDAETDSIPRNLRMETTESNVQSTTQRQCKEKPPDKVSEWTRIKGFVLELGFGLLLIVIAFRLFISYVKRE